MPCCIADVNPQHLDRILLKTYERAPENFETLLGMEGVGAEDAARARAGLGDHLRHAGEHARSRAVLLRARRQGRLSLSGGLETYDKTVEVLRAAVNKANIDRER